MPPRSYIEAMDRPTVLYILYTMVSAQQTNLLPKNASQNDAIFAQKVYRIYATTSQYLDSYGCTITMVYIYTMVNKMAEGDKYLDYRDETLERTAKPWNNLLGVFIETKWRVLNTLKLPHRTGRRKTGNPQLHPSRVSSLLSSQQRGARLKLLIYMLAGCLLCITHK